MTSISRGDFGPYARGSGMPPFLCDRSAVQSTVITLAALSRLAIGIALALVAPAAEAIDSAASGYWTNPATWSGSVVPGNGADVVILNTHSVTADVSSATLNSLTANSGGTLVFSGWNTVIASTTITVNGTVTHPPQSDTNGTPGVYSDWTPDNRVFLQCSNLTVAGSGSITVDGKGYARGDSPATGRGPGGGQHYGGGGYGNRGGNYGSATAGGAPYGSPSNPQDPGSGGGYGDGGPGGAGGGLVRIEATGNVIVDGNITANGAAPAGATAGGGSGGGIYVGCTTLAGSGIIQADGGAGSSGNGRGGGGGRIAVIYDPASQSASGVPRIDAAGNTGAGDNAGGVFGNGYGWPGSLYFPDNRWLPETITFSGEWSVTNFTSWSPTNLTVSNAWIRFPQDGLKVTTSNILVTGTDAWRYKLEFTNATLVCSGSVMVAKSMLNLFGNGMSMPSLTIGGSMTLTNDARASFYAGATNGAGPAYGALVSVANDLTVWSNCWIYSYSHPTNGGSVFFQAKNVTIATPNAGFNANAAGFGLDCGPGKPQPNGFASGAGYGGEGGRYSTSDWGKTYGDSNAPALPGSGSLTVGGAVGGGLVWIKAAQTLRINGTISANGDGSSSGYSGGSGGGIYLTCKNFIGASSGLLQANGGSSRRGGGGGRIAVWRVNDKSTGAVQTSVTNGTPVDESRPSTPGTIVWGALPATGTAIMIH